MKIQYRKLTSGDLDTFIQMRISQLREEGATEDIDLAPSLKDYYVRHMADGTFVSEAQTSATDGFGHVQLGGLASHLAGIVKAHTGVKVRGIELSLLQRCGAHLASQTDIDEAFLAGKVAVESAVNGESGKMVAFARETSDGRYHCTTKLLPLTSVANFEKKVPLGWITPEKNQVTDAFVEYVLPLIQGEPRLPLENSLPRYARLKKVLAK